MWFSTIFALVAAAVFSIMAQAAPQDAASHIYSSGSANGVAPRDNCDVTRYYRCIYVDYLFANDAQKRECGRRYCPWMNGSDDFIVGTSTGLNLDTDTDDTAPPTSTSTNIGNDDEHKKRDEHSETPSDVPYDDVLWTPKGKCNFILYLLCWLQNPLPTKVQRDECHKRYCPFKEHPPPRLIAAAVEGSEQEHADNEKTRGVPS